MTTEVPEREARTHLTMAMVVLLVAMVGVGYLLVKKPPDCSVLPTAEETGQFLLSEESSFRNCILVASGEKGVATTSQIEICLKAAKTLKKSSVDDPKANP